MMTLSRFLSGGYLKRSDILLIRGKRSLFSLAVRNFTKSHYSHCAIVFAVPHSEEGFDRTFLIESTRGIGVDIVDVGHYLDSRSYDVAVLRLEKHWFTDEIAKLIRGHMLNFIGSEYDYRSIFEMLLRRISSSEVTIPSRFHCSAFVQYAYMAAIKKRVQDGSMNIEALHHVIFNQRLLTDTSNRQVLYTVPEDIARSEHLSWKYVVTDRCVHEVSSRSEAETYWSTA